MYQQSLEFTYMYDVHSNDATQMNHYSFISVFHERNIITISHKGLHHEYKTITCTNGFEDKS